jgi:hypothetical protein
MEKNGGPRNKLPHPWLLIFNKGAKNIHWRKDNLLIRGKLGRLAIQVGKNEIRPLYLTSYRNQLKMD